jgi:hypothetical protein
MKTFLIQPEATFYHVTTIEKWEKIKVEGFKSKGKKILVSRVGELPILLAIATEQLKEIYDTSAIVILKFPQIKNNFVEIEISEDYHADESIEWTKSFHNIIHRQFIPIEGIELMMTLSTNNNSFPSLITCFTQIACSSRENYMEHSIYERAKQLKYSNQI